MILSTVPCIPFGYKVNQIFILSIIFSLLFIFFIASNENRVSPANQLDTQSAFFYTAPLYFFAGCLSGHG